MVFRRRNFAARRKFRRPARRGYGSYGPPMRRPRWTRRRRVAQNLTREVRWFKRVASVNTVTPQGWLRYTVNPSSAPTTLQEAIQFTKFGSIWEEYKLLKMIVKFYPAHLGSESLVTPIGPAGPGQWEPRFYRGNVVSWVDPQGDSQAITNIVLVMGKPSARLHQPRHFIKRWLDRPRSGYPTWGTIAQDGIIQNPDPWNGMIRLFGEGFSPPQQSEPDLQVYYYAEVLYKVMFRSRQDL